MPHFDLGHNLKVSQSVSADLEGAYRLSKQILEAYKRQRFSVRFQVEKEFTELKALVSHSDGTRLTAQVKLKEAGKTRTTLEIQLTGKVYVGGLKGALADDEKVQSVAREKLLEEIAKALKKNGLAAALDAVNQREKIYVAYAQNQASRQQALA